MAKAKSMRGAEEMIEAMWDWGEEHPQASLAMVAGDMSQERRELTGEMLRSYCCKMKMGGMRRSKVRRVGRRRNQRGGRTRTAVHAEGHLKRAKIF